MPGMRNALGSFPAPHSLKKRSLSGWGRFLALEVTYSFELIYLNSKQDNPNREASNTRVSFEVYIVFAQCLV